ncbi:MAG: ATP-binding protein [Pirellulaceae bacterium]|jgi:CheY-like chemotaxis protein|nr:ATP-binding protein [Pirellulaceae bacterium]
MPTVLVVDDSAVDRRRVAGLLRTCPGLEVGFAVDGYDALRAIERAAPDLVLTDLIMPEMDGLELVAQVISRYPLVPVILMTGRGNEETAVRALKAGAASYVPKSLLASLLVETVLGVLEAARDERCEVRLMDCLTRSETTFRLGADASMIGPLVNYLHRNIRAIGWCDQATGIRVCVALEEALNNAMFHGNLEITSEVRTGDADVYRQLVAHRQETPPFCQRGLEVYARFTRQDATFVVRDDGPGFDPDALPDPTAPENLEKASGRGLLLMRTFMDSVEFNRRGNEVTMIKRAAAGSPPGDACGDD